MQNNVAAKEESYRKKESRQQARSGKQVYHSLRLSGGVIKDPKMKKKENKKREKEEKRKEREWLLAEKRKEQRKGRKD